MIHNSQMLEGSLFALLVIGCCLQFLALYSVIYRVMAFLHSGPRKSVLTLWLPSPPGSDHFSQWSFVRIFSTIVPRWQIIQFLLVSNCFT